VRWRAGPLILAALLVPPAHAQTISGRIFEDRDLDGIHDPGEPPLAGVPLRLVGTSQPGGPFDIWQASGSLGEYAFSPGNGCYLLDLPEIPGWADTLPRADAVPEGTPGYSFPVGLPRAGSLPRTPAQLATGPLVFAAAGDSIARNFNLCGAVSPFWYSREVRQRLLCAAPSATVTLHELARLGDHTDHLLIDDPNPAVLNNVFRLMEMQPHLITLSIIGNDLLGVDVGGTPSQAQINAAAAEILDARRNLQEILSTLVSEVPQADILLSTLYDNLAYSCASLPTTEFHRAWLPVVNRILKDVAWGQARQVRVAEVAQDFAGEDLTGACSGFEGLICRSFLDRIHPDNDGYEVVREKVWEAAGGLLLGSGDPLARTSIASVDHGFIRRVTRLYPLDWEVNGAAVTSPEAALSAADGQAVAGIQLGLGSQEFRVGRFPDWLDEIKMARLVAGIRYRTSGDVTDDFYRVEASLDGSFAPPPGHAFSPAAWNFSTPMVGGGGPNAPAGGSAFEANVRLLAQPEVPDFREVSATLTGNPVLAPAGDEYLWPAPTHADLVTAAIRVVAAPVAGTPGNDLFAVELESAWLDLYGWEVERPPESENVRLTWGSQGTLQVDFDPVAGAVRHNLYMGRLGSLRDAGYDHGPAAPAGPWCDVTSTPLPGGGRRVSLPSGQFPTSPFYVLITGHVDDVESPAGYSSTGVEIDRSQSTCR
jgi:hypothetical protein